MSRGMVAFLAGLGGGYLKAQDKRIEDERRAKIDAREEERFAREKKGWQEQDKLNQDLRDAAADRTVVSGTVTQSADGNKVLTTDPQQAAAIQKTLADEAELRGEAAPTSRAGQAVAGNMARGNQITDGPVDVAALNSPDARNQRTVDALQKNGQIERAATMQNTMLDQQAKRLGLESAQAKFADEQFNRKLTERLSGPNWKDEAASVLNDTQVGTLAGATVKAVPKEGGKFDFVATKDGQSRVLGSFEDTDAGRAKFMQQVGRVSLESKIGWIVEGEKAKREEERWQQTFDFNKKKEENDQQYRQRMLGLQYAQERRLAQAHKATMEDAKIPPGVKLQAQTLAKQMETANMALSKAMAEGMFDPNNEGTKELIKTQRVLGLQYQRLMAPYIPGSENKADPLGLNGGGDKEPAAAPSGAPAAAPAAAPTMTRPAAAPVAQAAPTAPTMQQTVARPQPTLAEVIAGPSSSGNPALMASAQQKAQVIDGLAQQIKAAQAQVATTARSGGDVKAAMDQVAALRAQAIEATANMNPQLAAQVLATAGIK
jgi:hypothetical protein